MMEDQEIERLAGSLGGDAAERLEVERVAAGVVARLRADRMQAPQRWRWMAPAWLRLAAALAVLIAGGALVRGALHRPASEPTAVVAAPMLGDLTNDELVEVFDSLSVEAPVHEGLAVGLESLNEAQLEELLRLMEG